MFSIFGSGNTTPNQLIDWLEAGKECPDDQPINFGRNYENRHCNTLLLQALAWNRLTAASKLLALDTNRVALNMKDTWPTAQNTPLILAAKIGSLRLVRELIAAGADVNAQDYRGFTALHYACMLRDDDMIRALLQARADILAMDVFGNQPVDYYRMQITGADLEYSYGRSQDVPELLRSVPDSAEDYFATRTKYFSALRWFIAHITVNHGYGENDKVEGNTLQKYAQFYLRIRTCMDNALIYEAMMKCFVNNRPAPNQALSKNLTGVIDAYNAHQYDRHHLSPLYFVPATAVSVNRDQELWIELQAMPANGRRRS